MFRKTLAEKLSNIFGLSKTTYSAISDQFEQEVLFIQINACKTRASQGVVYAKVTGSIVVFSQNDKLLYGYFAKRIEQASNEVKKGLYFLNVDTNNLRSDAVFQNISERRTDFIYLYEAQYDPNHGEMTSLDLEYEE